MPVDNYEPAQSRTNAAPVIVLIVVAVLAIVGAFAFGLIDIDQTKETELPAVAVTGGQAPAFDVDTAKVDVGTKSEDVTLPKVDVGTTKEEIKVPTVDVEKAR